MTIDSDKRKIICLIIPSLGPGGAEKVMCELAGWFGKQKGLQIFLISITKTALFHDIPPQVQFIEPKFYIHDQFRIISLIKTGIFLREQIKKLKPQIVLNFGGKYNSFVLLSVSGLPVKTYISERSRPSISYGWLLDRINPFMYKKSAGIIAQTATAGNYIFKKTKHKRIKVIGNPINIDIDDTSITNKENIILNVGRFISTKGQIELLKIFESISCPGWKLVFLGNGPDFEKVKQHYLKTDKDLNVEFPGFIKDVKKYYTKSKIFAFTSSSEGFPNALAEAMAYGLACISYDCEAGPSELIENGKNGFLVKVHDHNDFKLKLIQLMNNEELRKIFCTEAKKKIESFDIKTIGKSYLEFILDTEYENHN